MRKPLIGITVDNKDAAVADASGTYESHVRYSACVAKAGGVPVLLPQEPDLVDEYLRLCDGILFTGGNDARVDEIYGEPLHPKSKPVDPRRQAFELALLRGLRPLPEKPVLGICFGMQIMTLAAGGKMNQHLPDTLNEVRAHVHQKCNKHEIEMLVSDSPLDPDTARGCAIVSSHHQAMTDTGSLRLIAQAPDGTVEAVDDPSRPFYLGVQWHPERGGDGALNQGVIDLLVEACRHAMKE